MLLSGGQLFLGIFLWFPSNQWQDAGPQVVSSLRSGLLALGWGLRSPHLDLALLMMLGKSQP